MLSAMKKEFSSLFGGVSLPSAHEVQWLSQEVQYTPDNGYLEQYEFQLLFCPDDTKTGHNRHCLIEENAFVATAYTNQLFNFYEQRVGDERIPIPMLSPEGAKLIPLGQVEKLPQPRRIQGELLAVRTHQIKGLDTYKRNRRQFLRKRVKLLVPYREVIVSDYLDDTGRELPLCLRGKKGVHGPELVYENIRAWMYVGMPQYWDDLLDGGFRGFRPVNHFQSRREWLKEYYAYPRQPLEDS